MALTDRIIKIKKDSTNTEIGTIDLLNLQAGLAGRSGVSGSLYVSGIETAIYSGGFANFTLETELPDATTKKYGEQIMIAPSGDVYFRERNPIRWVLNGRILIG